MTSTTQAKNDVNLRHIFKDLVFGWSHIFDYDKPAYLKHLSVFDQVDIEEIRQGFYENAKKRGLPTQEDALKRLEEEGLWTSHDEGKIKQQEQYLEQVQNTKKELYLKKQIDQVNADIKEGERKLYELKLQKEDLIGQTCDKYAESRVSDYYIIKSLHKDVALKESFYSQKDVDNMRREEMSKVVESYNKTYSVFSDDNIQRVILQDFYQPYLPFCETVTNMFSKPLFELSMNQVKLVIYSRMFKNIFENYPKIPERIKTDPQKVVDYVNAQEKAKDKLQNVDKEGASTVFGAEKQDYEYLGVQQAGGDTLSKKLKEKGGKMDMKDLMSILKD
tara:strand:- start:2495 stop:3493 length:999 start_codon:yes stop_codon:yes gene_type:complete